MKIRHCRATVSSRKGTSPVLLIRNESFPSVRERLTANTTLAKAYVDRRLLFYSDFITRNYMEELRNKLTEAVRGYEKEVSIDAIIKQCEIEIHEGMSPENMEKALLMVTRSMIERDPAYSKVAMRLLLAKNRTEVTHSFSEFIVSGIAAGRIDSRMKEFDLKKLSHGLQHERDELFNYLGFQTLYDRYFMRDHDTNIILETPQFFWMRVAMGTALTEKPEDRDRVALEFYEIMSDFSYTPSTPTLFHAGTTKPQLSSCYITTVPDSLDGIFKSYSDNAQLSKWSGGIGTDWTNIRGTGSFIKGTGVESQGVIPFLKIANDATVAINRSGRRRGAACVYLETWHYDILDFLELRKNTGDERRRTHDMDTANWIPDLFMKRVKAGEQWSLFSPEEVPELHELYGIEFEKKYEEYEKKADAGKMKTWKRVPAGDIWKKMLAMLFETGHPWITFKDPCNVRSPQDHVGVVHSSNLCTEITLNTSFEETAVCNLGSLNFAKFVVDGIFDKEYVGRVTKIAMRMLDNTIDINFYPTEEARVSNMRHRPVGLGLRGFQDALYLLGINFDTEAAVKFAGESMECISYYALLASSELAKEKGSYGSYEGSKWSRGILPQDTVGLLEVERGTKISVPRKETMDWKKVREHIAKYGMRNSNCLAVAPTATTANIVGCVPTIEPIYKNLYVKSNQAGDFTVINEYLVRDLKARGLWTEELRNKLKVFDGSVQQITEIPEEVREKYKETFEIDSRWLILSAAYRSVWIDQSQSLNIYFRGSSGGELSELYFFAWELGLKTTYYLRTLSASQVEKSTVQSQFSGTHTRSNFVMPPVSAESMVCESCEA